MSTRVVQPLDLYTDLDGAPLDAGYIYIGTQNLNPETNPITVYVDSAATIPIAQPIRTTAGYPVYTGNAAKLYVPGDYSITVRDKNGALVYADWNAARLSASQLLTALLTVDGSGSGLVAEGLQSTQITDLNFDPTLLGLAVREVRIYTTSSSPSNQPGGVVLAQPYTVVLSQPSSGEYRVLLIPSGGNGGPITRTYTSSAWGSWSNQVVTVSSTPYTQTTGIGPTTYYVTTGGSGLTFNLASAASQLGRTITIIKADSGAGSVGIVPNGTDVLGWIGNTAIGLQLQYSVAVLTATAAGRWDLIGYPYQMTSGFMAANYKFQSYHGGSVNGTITLPTIAVGETILMWYKTSGATNNWVLPASGTFDFFGTLIAGGTESASVATPGSTMFFAKAGGSTVFSNAASGYDHFFVMTRVS